jgi:Tfp pilus assembly protein PilN
LIKINLLPAYVIERRKVRVFSMIAAVALVVEIAVLGFFYNKQRTLEAALNEAKTKKSSEKQQVDALQQEAQGEQAKNQPFQNVIDFIKKTKDSARRQGQLLSELRKYIYWRVLVTDIDISDGQNVRLSCATDSVDSYARFVSNFMGCPLFDQSPLFSGIGGGGGGGGMMGGGMPGMPMGAGMGGVPGMDVGMRGGGMSGGMSGGASGSESSTDPLPIKFSVTAHLAAPYQTTGIPMPSGDVTVTGAGGGGGGMGGMGDMGMMMGGGMGSAGMMGSGGMQPGMPSGGSSAGMGGGTSGS